ncbi:hypothetical protein Ddye_018880 [Dipteronia dyeriana]|uniref:Ubiquitin-like domain-containing protein n=1 Tax=Dipteronia dyeriana TaxID=168575 RepID=A0AAD9TWS3_9ROSI|nr:hypothetical protein Ddye_018880 [Dipteronia dyeriana]
MRAKSATDERSQMWRRCGNKGQVDGDGRVGLGAALTRRKSKIKVEGFGSVSLEMMESSRAQTSTRSQLNTEEDINVYMKVMKTVAMKVKKSETVRNLKALFCEKEGTSEGVKDLFFSGEQ